MKSMHSRCTISNPVVALIRRSNGTNLVLLHDFDDSDGTTRTELSNIHSFINIVIKLLKWKNDTLTFHFNYFFESEQNN